MARDIIAVVAGALALTAAFPKADIHALAWVALVPLLLSSAGGDRARGWWLGVLFGFVHQATALYWLSHAMTHFGGLSLPLAAVATLALAAYLAIFWGLLGIVASRADLRHPAGPLLVAAAWAGLAWAQSWLLSGFPWTLLGYAAARTDTLGQLASVTGVYGPGFLAVAINGSIAALLLHRRAALPSAVLPVAGLLAATLFGIWELAGAPAAMGPAGEGALRVGMVQGNVPQDRKWSPEARQQVMQDHLRLTRDAVAEGAQVVFWPESSWPDAYGLERDATAQALLGDIAGSGGVALVVGTVHVGEDPGGDLWVANSAVLVDADGSLGGRYDKTHLVPFGEYLPLRRWLGALGPLVQAVGEMREGSASQPPLRSAAGPLPPVGLSICYEIIFPGIAARQARQGAELLATLTNDAWYGDTSGPYQHVAMARLRAIENRRWLVRAANTGISAVFDPWGRQVVASRLNEQTTLTAAVQPRTGLTLYSRRGDVFAVACALVTGVALLLVGWPTRGARRR